MEETGLSSTSSLATIVVSRFLQHSCLTVNPPWWCTFFATNNKSKIYVLEYLWLVSLPLLPNQMLFKTDTAYFFLILFKSAFYVWAIFVSIWTSFKSLFSKQLNQIAYHIWILVRHCKVFMYSYDLTRPTEFLLQFSLRGNQSSFGQVVMDQLSKNVPPRKY